MSRQLKGEERARLAKQLIELRDIHEISWVELSKRFLRHQWTLQTIYAEGKEYEKKDK